MGLKYNSVICEIVFFAIAIRNPFDNPSSWKSFGSNPFKVARKFLFRLSSNVYTGCAVNNVRNVAIQASSSQTSEKYSFKMSTASNTSKKFQLACEVIGFPMLSANHNAQNLSSKFKNHFKRSW